MWWYYEKVFEDDAQIQYAYARQSKQPSGVVGFVKTSGEYVMIRPAQMDDDAYAQERALRHMHDVQARGFPQSTRVICG